MEYNIPYGKGVQKLLTDKKAYILESDVDSLVSSTDQEGTVRQALENPIGSVSLAQLAVGKKNAVVIISDHTRPVPSKFILPPMLMQLRQNNPNIAITLLVATGCHRGTTKQELIEKLGEEIVSCENIVVHDCDESELTEMGLLPSGAKLFINSLVAQAELVVSEGFIEPHFFAGFSGGRKSILPGVCGRISVLGNHCAKFIDSPYACAGELDKNPINIDMESAVRMANLKFIVNVVINDEKKIVAAFAGDAIEAHRRGCNYLGHYCTVTPKHKGDIVITSNGGAPLDQNVYQAVKGLSAAYAAAALGGVIIICAECADGIGGDEFYNALKNCDGPSGLLDEIRSTPMDETVPDQWQYQILANILKQHRVIFVASKELEQEINEMKMEFAPNLQKAYELAVQEKTQDATLVIIPNGVSIIIN